MKETLGLNRVQLAARIADDIPEGWTVNLGIGQPTTVADHVPLEREVIFHSENGVLGFGPAPKTEEEKSLWLVNAGKQHITLRKGGAYVHHADSFALIRGRHLDLCVLGAYEVADNGDFANWSTGGDLAPAVGGAMDLAVGAKRIWIMMDHMTREGASRLVSRCRYPLTAAGVVTRVYTNLAAFELGPEGFVVRDLAPGVTFDMVKERTAGRLVQGQAH